MSPIGRIFSILNLVLAAVFLAWAGTTLANSREYKDKYEAEQKAHEATKTDLSGQLATVRRDLEDKSNAANSLTADKEELSNRIGRLETDLSAAKEENSKLNEDVGRLSNSFDSIQAQNKDLISQKDTAVQAKTDADNRASAAERSEQQAKSKLQEIQQQNLALSNQISDLQKQATTSTKEIDSLNTQLAQLTQLTGASLSDIIPQKRITGTVMQAVYDVPPGLVAINKGAKDGVVRGYTWEIYKGTQYKGRVRVENVRDDMSTCIILDTVPGAKISQGDEAATVL